MNPPKSVSVDITKCVEAAVNEILITHKTETGEDSLSSTVELFLKLFPSNLARAINIVFFKEDGHVTDDEMDRNKEMLEHEKAIMDIISKRRQGTTACLDVLKKTLSIEKRIMMELDVNSEVVSVHEFEKQAVPYKKDELKIGAKKTLEHLKNSVKAVFDLTDRAEELAKAAMISKEADETDLELISPYLKNQVLEEMCRKFYEK